MDQLSKLLQDRRVVLGLGAAVALALGLVIALTITSKHDQPAAPPPASQGGLIVENGKPDDGKLDPARPLRCFVGGQFVGELTLAECAKKNGVATGALDVGVDASGQLAAADQAGTTLTPLPPPETGPSSAPVISEPTAPAPSAGAPATPAAPVQAALGACWRYAGGSWSQVGRTTQAACVSTLYNGVCQRGGALYGRWGEQTLRLVPGRVEISPDNRSFHVLVEQGPGCSIGAG